MKNKILHKLRIALLICAIGYIIFGVGTYLYDWRIVGIAEGSKIHYNDKVYIETFDTYDIEREECLGSIEYSGTKCRLYSIKDLPDYLYLDMNFLDYRLYKVIGE